MISYCIALYRPTYARLLLAELAAKTSVPYEILAWLNVVDADLEADIAAACARGVPLRVLGRSPENIGMRAYPALFGAARYRMIVQIDDDVVCIGRGIAERAARLFARYPGVRQLVADVWQDEHTTGARPPLDQYRLYSAEEGLYDGPVDGWFSIYHGELQPMLASLPAGQYSTLGAAVRARLQQRGQGSLLDAGSKVFHVIGPAYADGFGMLDFEIAKYRRLGRDDIVAWYEGYRAERLPPALLAERIAAIRASIDGTAAA